MKKRWIAIGLLVTALFTMSGCESDVERAERELKEATKKAQEAREKANDAQEQLNLLETLFGDN